MQRERALDLVLLLIGGDLGVIGLRSLYYFGSGDLGIGPCIMIGRIIRSPDLRHLIDVSLV